MGATSMTGIRYVTDATDVTEQTEMIKLTGTALVEDSLTAHCLTGTQVQ